MRELGMSRKGKCRTKPGTKSDKAARFAPNTLNRDFVAGRPNSKWVTDTKAVETTEGWLYLAVILDVFSRKMVGWAMGASDDAALTSLSLRMALARRQPGSELLLHSDRGTECTAEQYQSIVRELGIEMSMSRTGNCWDHAVMEAFWASLAKECVNRVRFESRQEARSAIFEYLECFYNPMRLHSTLAYVSPLAQKQAYRSKMS
jgi:transposase InsO family protein